MTGITLHIGDPAYSSWSLRAWLALRRAGVAFRLHTIPLDQAETHEAIKAVSPSATVPAITGDGVLVWDTLAICEWANEQAQNVLWPNAPARRAVARSVSATMHASFAALRDAAPMNLHRRGAPLAQVEPSAMTDLAHLEHLWRIARDHGDGGGPFLMGQWSLADAMATPYATRIRSYDLPVSAQTRAYCEAVCTDPDYLDWEARGLDDPVRKPDVDDL